MAALTASLCAVKAFARSVVLMPAGKPVLAMTAAAISSHACMWGGAWSLPASNV